MDVFSELKMYFELFPFVRYAMIVGVLIALCSSLLGVTLVLKRFSFIGDGLSHVAFGAMACVAVVGLTNEMLIVMPVTIICAILILKSGANTKIKGDAALAMISVGALAMGYLVMNLFPSSSNISADVCTTLFGSTSILTLSKAKVIMCIVFALIVLAIFIVLYNKIFAITFDEDYAKVSGIKTELLKAIVSVVIAVVIVLAMNLVGSLLISALIIFPALSSMRLFKSFKAVTISSSIISVTCAVLGILVSIVASTPIGPTIVGADILCFFICFMISLIMKKSPIKSY